MMSEYEASLARLSVTELGARIASGQLTSEAVVAACLKRIEERESTVGAWESLHADEAVAQAQTRDRESPRGPLHGVPIGIKDIIDTADMPTKYGSTIFATHQPDQDAKCISQLQAAGAVILGKTVTTEFAYFTPRKTANPFDPQHTPGGSSSGSAAAVADRHVPLALGTQTAGSIIRPASFCGVIGYKPTFGAFSFDGIHPLAPSFDTLGGFARSVEDIRLLRSVLIDTADESTNINLPPKVTFVKGPFWSLASSETQKAVVYAVDRLRNGGATIGQSDLPRDFDDINELQNKVMLRECSSVFVELYESEKEHLSETLRHAIEYGQALCEDEVRHARDQLKQCGETLDEITAGYDVVLTPAAPGAAPKGLQSTGDPMFSRMWTALGLPCLCLPCMRSGNGLPIGVQLVGQRDRDKQLLEVVCWVESQFMD